MPTLGSIFCLVALYVLKTIHTVLMTSNKNIYNKLILGIKPSIF